MIVVTNSDFGSTDDVRRLYSVHVLEPRFWMGWDKFIQTHDTLDDQPLMDVALHCKNFVEILPRRKVFSYI